MLNQFGAVAGKQVDDGDFNHCVAAGLLAQRGAGDIDEHLGGERGVVDLHIELETLVLRFPETPLRTRFTP